MGRSPCCSKEGLKKGAWTAMEDKILTEYISIHGIGQWKYLSEKAGLKRCGKSCGLRWLNYLKPGRKRGNISQEEEDLIIRLHNLFGNRWTLIAERLPGRTDNEIKNYWNTKLRNLTSSKPPCNASAFSSTLKPSKEYLEEQNYVAKNYEHICDERQPHPNDDRKPNTTCNIITKEIITIPQPEEAQASKPNDQVGGDVEPALAGGPSNITIFLDQFDQRTCARLEPCYFSSLEENVREGSDHFRFDNYFEMEQFNLLSDFYFGMDLIFCH